MAFARATAAFAAWGAKHDLFSLDQIQPVHVGAYVELLQKRLAPPSVTQHLAALRMLFDWLVIGQVMPSIPASVVRVRGPKHSTKRGKTAVLAADEARAMLDAIDITTIGLRDRALLALMVYTFARVGAAVQMRVEMSMCKVGAAGCACTKKAARST